MRFGRVPRRVGGTVVRCRQRGDGPHARRDVSGNQCSSRRSSPVRPQAPRALRAAEAFNYKPPFPMAMIQLELLGTISCRNVEKIIAMGPSSP
ncbi:Hypothetical protein NTJ_05861 [Nesidiocoris tenuis]|uniref:Uncharacterized protein n=1 Tax=Nesidiocoris tenuis TaxID=355587 RepID=A0ABN7ARQ6_9HEMI|nr:Hypothetical protein NTJ_05861 [Nesidiocoris tenuis]